MALFKKNDPPPTPRWRPKVDLTTARPVVFALANAPVSNDGQVRSALADFRRLSERPPLEVAVGLIQNEPDVLDRPWIWLAAVMRVAADSGDDHLCAAALFWSCYWTSDLVPRNNLGGFMDLELDPISDQRKTEILSVGVGAARRLPAEFVVVGDESGKVLAGPLGDQAQAILGA